MADNVEKGDGRPSGGGAPIAGAVTSHLVEGATMTLPDGCVVTVREGMLEVSDGQRLPLPSAGGNVTIERRVKRPDGRTVLVRHTIRMEEARAPAKSEEPEDLPAVPDGTGEAENSNQVEADTVNPTSEGTTEPPGEGVVEQGPSDQEPLKVNSDDQIAKRSSLTQEETDEIAVLREYGASGDIPAVDESIADDEPPVAVVEIEAVSINEQKMPENTPITAPDSKETEAAPKDISSEGENEPPKCGSEGWDRKPLAEFSEHKKGDEPSELAPSNEEINMFVAKEEDVIEPGSDHVEPELSDEVPKTDADTKGCGSDDDISLGKKNPLQAHIDELRENALAASDTTDQVENLSKDLQPTTVKDEVPNNESKSPNHSSEHSRRHPTKYLVHQDSISIMRSVPRLHSKTFEPVEKREDKDITDEVQMRLGPILHRLGYANSATKQDCSDESKEAPTSATESPEEPEHVSVTDAIHFFESITPQRVESPVLKKHPPRSSLSPSQKRADTKSPEPCLVSPGRASPGRASPRRVNFASRAQKVYISSQEPDETEDILVPCPHDDSPPQDIPDPFYTEPAAAPAVMKLPTKITMIPAQKPSELGSDSCNNSDNDPADIPSSTPPMSKNGDIQQSNVHTLYSKASMGPVTCAGPRSDIGNAVTGSNLDAGQQPVPDDDPELVEDLMTLMSDIEALDAKSPRNLDDTQNQWPGHLRLAEEETSTASLDGDLSDGSPDTTPPTSSANQPSAVNGVRATEAVPQLGVDKDGYKVVSEQPMPLTSDGDETDRLQPLTQTELQDGDEEGRADPKDPFLPNQKEQEKEVNWLSECLFCCCCWAP